MCTYSGSAPIASGTAKAAYASRCAMPSDGAASARLALPTVMPTTGRALMPSRFAEQLAAEVRPRGPGVEPDAEERLGECRIGDVADRAAVVEERHAVP